MRDYVYYFGVHGPTQAYDPRFSSVPVPLGDFNRIVRGLNPGVGIR